MKEIVVPILNNEYKAIVCWGKPQYIAKVLKSWGHKKETTEISGDMENKRGVCFYSKNCAPVIALPKKPETAEEIGTLTHEAVHAVVNIFEMIDERSMDEVFAHSVGAIVRHALGNKKL